MKKNLVALLLVLAVVSVGVFANPHVAPESVPNATFNVVTAVTAINAMRFTDGAVGNYGAFQNATLNTALVKADVEASSVEDSLTEVGYLSIASNYRKGVHVDMTASAMACTTNGVTSHIHYTIALGTDDVGTKTNSSGGTSIAKNDIFGTLGQNFTGMTVKSVKISLKVESADLAAALEGSYTGTVVFDYVANT